MTACFFMRAKVRHRKDFTSQVDQHSKFVAFAVIARLDRGLDDVNDMLRALLNTSL